MSKKQNSLNPDQVVNLWERLELNLDIDNKKASFITRIEDIDKDKLTVESPVRISGDIELAVGQQIEAVSNKPDASFIFKAVVSEIDPHKENLTVLKPISKVERSQRRRFVRIDIAGGITFKTLDTSDSAEVCLGSEKKGELLNISAGGILIMSTEPLKQNDYLLMNFWMKNSQRLENILGIIKRVETSVDSETQESDNLVGIEFLTKEKSMANLSDNLNEILPPDTNYFSEALQQLVVQFVYKQQVEFRAKTKVDL